MIILSYDGVKDKESTLRAMTSLDKEEFEELCIFLKKPGMNRRREKEEIHRKVGENQNRKAWKIDYFLFFFTSKPIRFRR